jgi:hypothetical protein
MKNKTLLYILIAIVCFDISYGAYGKSIYVAGFWGIEAICFICLAAYYEFKKKRFKKQEVIDRSTIQELQYNAEKLIIELTKLHEQINIIQWENKK